MNVSSATSKKTVYEAILSVLATAILTSCAAEQKQERTSTQDQGSAFEIVEKMRGISMQIKPNARPWCLDYIRREEIMAEFRLIGEEAVPAIAGALKDPDVQMRRNATLVLDDMAWTVDIRAAIPSLISAIEDPDNDVRLYAFIALGEIGPDAKEAVPALTRMLKDTEPGSRAASAIALGNIGAAAETAIPALRKALNDPNDDVRKFSKQSIDLIEKACAQDDQRN